MNIEKCRGINCPIKDQCFRYVAPEDLDYQSWGDFSYDDVLEKCIDFWNKGEKLYGIQAN